MNPTAGSIPRFTASRRRARCAPGGPRPLQARARLRLAVKQDVSKGVGSLFPCRQGAFSQCEYASPCRHGKRLPTPCRCAAGYTLLEVLLSLVLTSLVLLCVAMAIDFQLRIADAGRTRVEESQLARVLLHRIAEDIRGAVLTDPLKLAELTSPQSGSAAAGESTEASSDETDAPEETQPPAQDSPEQTADQTSDPAASLVPHAVPGIYGEAEWLQVDIGRPSRVRRPAESAAEELPLVPTGDLKTVAYYVTTADDSANLTAGESTGGLVRRELDRPVTAWASEQGAVEQLEVGETPIAPEVQSIQFRYSDGTDWYDAWDMEENGGLPKAVEISLALRPVRPNGNGASQLATATGLSSSDEEEVLVYRLIVDVPRARAESSGASGSEADASGETDMLDSDTSGSQEMP